jgi:hypothetical protein
MFCHGQKLMRQSYEVFLAMDIYWIEELCLGVEFTVTNHVSLEIRTDGGRITNAASNAARKAA